MACGHAWPPGADFHSAAIPLQRFKTGSLDAYDCDKYINREEVDVRLEEIAGKTAGDRRVKRLKANAQAAREKAGQLKRQADMAADQLERAQSRADVRASRALAPTRPK
jgi:hypothetical protein